MINWSPGVPAYGWYLKRVSHFSPWANTALMPTSEAPTWTMALWDYTGQVWNKWPCWEHSRTAHILGTILQVYFLFLSLLRSSHSCRPTWCMSGSASDVGDGCPMNIWRWQRHRGKTQKNLSQKSCLSPGSALKDIVFRSPKPFTYPLHKSSCTWQSAWLWSVVFSHLRGAKRLDLVKLGCPLKTWPCPNIIFFWPMVLWWPDLRQEVLQLAGTTRRLPASFNGSRMSFSIS